MRIGAGERKGLSLPFPKGLQMRPTLGRVREALFDILSTQIEGSTFLDLYAGTGCIGLEAHSRGASRVIFVEQHQKTSALLHRNVQRYCDSMPREVRSELRIHTLDVEAYLSQRRQCTTPIDIIFADPPYDTSVAHMLIDHIPRGARLQPDGVLVIEHRFKHTMDDTCGRFSKTRTYRYGDSALSMYKLTHAPSTLPA